MNANVDRLSTDELRSSREAWWSVQFDEFLWSGLADVRPAGILDIGCGIGTLAQHLAPRLPPGTTIVGIDIDLLRLQVAARGNRDIAPGVSVSYAAADGLSLPFGDDKFGASVVILTLQHVPEPTRVLSEMRRVTGPGGVVVAVEADNVGQRLYLPHSSPSLDAALAAYWRGIQERCKPADIAVGPRLPLLFRRAGLPSPSVRGHLLASASWVDAPVFAQQSRAGFLRVARKHGFASSAECQALLEEIERLAVGSPEPFYAISTVPLFMAVASV